MLRSPPHHVMIAGRAQAARCPRARLWRDLENLQGSLKGRRICFPKC